ncbi:MAG: hypothetical protein CMM45_03180 [Rhodospirillaceae bacterium]|nr:hypothetical protein [Rhodospirillaceae bacterium]
MSNTGREILVRLEELVPSLRDRGQVAEQAGRIPEETIRDLDASGVMRAVVPESAGGLEVEFPIIPQIFRVLGNGCIATSWTMGFLIYHNFQFAHFPEKTQKEVFNVRGYTMAPGHVMPSGEAREVEGGYKLTGRWNWCTGIQHADWVLLSAPVIAGEACDHQGNKHALDLRRFFIPADKCKILNNWDVSAMSATGSYDIELNEVFVPEHHQIKVESVATRTSPGLEINRGPLWRVPFITFASIGAIGSVIGGTEGLLEIVTKIMETKVGGHTRAKQRDLSTQQVRLARLSTSLNALVKLWEDKINFIWTNVTQNKEISLEDRIEARMVVSHCAKCCDEIANELAVSVGSRSIYNDSHVQRFRREINALATHAFFDYDSIASLHGSTLMGLKLEPNNMI